ncbi:MAG TPA: hypothetical protein VHE34_23400 [Puia sp.]|uniref:hypothetical protein n=1 Tax=Puia sp. TaxID=2045100 RepID=UPI002C48D790|nr:hypothetical protein [Puia sp.]HVU98197.1 hypothetical protein [Puia sp.]
MNQLIDSYYPAIFNSVVRLTGHTDEKQLKALTENILAELRQRMEELSGAQRKGVFVYRVVLKHVFAFLKERQDELRIGFLRKTLPICRRGSF